MPQYRSGRSSGGNENIRATYFESSHVEGDSLNVFTALRCMLWRSVVCGWSQLRIVASGRFWYYIPPKATGCLICEGTAASGE
jgi:hypothetical protein